MNLHFDLLPAARYTSRAQKIRVMSESWLVENFYCLHCGGLLAKKANNNPVGDVFCSACGFEYELKSGRHNFSSKINDGAYSAMLARLRSGRMPTFLCLTYSDNFTVSNLLAIPGHFFDEACLIQRPPLPPTARRAGWVGCKIDLTSFPLQARLKIVENGKPAPRAKVLAKFNKMLFLGKFDPSSRCWTLEIIKLIERLHKSEFTISEIYGFIPELQKRHPGNHHIRAKIRQQLQLLRDNRYLEFTGRGCYRILRCHQNF